MNSNAFKYSGCGHVAKMTEEHYKARLLIY